MFNFREARTQQVHTILTLLTLRTHHIVQADGQTFLQGSSVATSIAMERKAWPIACTQRSIWAVPVAGLHP